MLGFFPSPFPDEIFYSLCARYGARVNYPVSDELSSKLFGTPNAAAVFDLPGNLNRFIKELPPNKCFRADNIIKRFTLLPYYKPFILPMTFKQIERRMLQSNGRGIHTKLGLTAARVKATKYLRYCALCFKEDEARLGERYWHRSHQMPGVHICWIHGIWLTESNIRTTGSRHLQEYAPARDVQSAEGKSEFSEEIFAVLRSIAQSSNILLNGNFGPFTKKALSENYKSLLMERGLATPTGSLRVNKLLSEFTSFYPPQLIRFLGCEFTGRSGNDDNWLLRMLRKPECVQHPLYHILLAGFLNRSIENLLNSIGKFSTLKAKLFGAGPWHCLNAAANHYKKRIITSVVLASRSRNGKIAGVFECRCGFIYARSGPDEHAKDKFRIDKMISFGPVWEAELKRLVNLENPKLTAIAGLLKVDPLTVKRYAERAGIKIRNRAKNYKELKQKDLLKESVSKNINKIERSTRRREWRQIIESSDGKSLKELRTKKPIIVLPIVYL